VDGGKGPYQGGFREDSDKEGRGFTSVTKLGDVMGGVDVVVASRRRATWTVAESWLIPPDGCIKGRGACYLPSLHSDVAHDGPSISKSRCEARERLFLWCRNVPGSYRSLVGALPSMPISTKSKDRPNMANTLPFGRHRATGGALRIECRMKGRHEDEVIAAAAAPVAPPRVIAHDPASADGRSRGQEAHATWAIIKGAEAPMIRSRRLANTAAMSGLLKGGGFFDHELRVPDVPSRSEEPRLRLDTQGKQDCWQSRAGFLSAHKRTVDVAPAWLQMHLWVSLIRGRGGFFL
ncbi:hypothetical protein BN1708_002285, partial [Verticillium longisporum]